ncbi:MAG: hypothetical protein C4522_12215 [Desulfobacteraceae bacterium]|nr:MAG: hypothetical protein C4522_12215 [Desulfobacteraceae bacterium]
MFRFEESRFLKFLKTGIRNSYFVVSSSRNNLLERFPGRILLGKSRQNPRHENCGIHVYFHLMTM